MLGLLVSLMVLSEGSLAGADPRLVLECAVAGDGKLSNCALVSTDCAQETYVRTAIRAGDALRLPKDHVPQARDKVRIDFTCEAIKRYRTRESVDIPWRGQGAPRRSLGRTPPH